MSSLPPIERRDPGIVLVLGFVTCGLYLLFWYYMMYEELEKVGGRTPTANSYVVDLLLTLVTCTLYGIWVDYKISDQFNEIHKTQGLPANDTTTIVVALDIAAWITGMITNIVASAIHQDQLNKVVKFVEERGGAPAPRHTPVLGSAA